MGLFEQKKSLILQELDKPPNEYSDLSPKGSIDAEIRELISNINKSSGLVTTSSCSGRVSVFLEGRRTPSTADAGTVSNYSGGKGGGRWLFVSHCPFSTLPKVDDFHTFLKLSHGKEPPKVLPQSHKLIHFKFEPFILHVLAASLEHAESVTSSALQAGFRESGIATLNPQPDGTYMPIVAVRSAGLSLDSIIGFEEPDTGELFTLVDESYLNCIALVSEKRFAENSKRIERFSQGLFRNGRLGSNHNAQNQVAAEGQEERRRRKREEGLKRQAESKFSSRHTAHNDCREDRLIDSSTELTELFDMPDSKP
ncbi:hypothetical protein P152DRAFT_507499 [Eremomyces bilateralis CBS 781.70]|uniref:tRNA(Phe) 7-[(3-amino-3-carboxypropyl)-4-demethylwyosine(37)-N(4)]-methyltransferase n=1 Tax=Eremomyces bilateralis CBS 781.70 TaxID=1392243 RepID=A0A6G1G3Q0_9PEZI|nr:uncharacterized protein P152DRAFT_507499 [Eremomyces bilateralis CBS 781.70]KAF1812694.1 hypothetical protein P152DRAFT_507499 [Eremomyces bilateralis CBS 781.70]